MDRVFEGVTVIELAQFVFVPGAGALMADQGAEVIKIETPGIGDPYRTLKVGDGRETSNANLSMELNNHSKKSVSINLKDPAGRELLLKLIEDADVFLTSLRPKALKALRLDVDDLRARNPRIIYARGNGLGSSGPESDKAGYDASAFWARGGFADLLTRPDAKSPTRSRPAMGDHAGSVSLTMGIAGALFRRERTGKGMVVESSLLANAIWILSSDVTVSQVPTYDEHTLIHNEFRYPLMTPYRTRDHRWIQLMLLAPDRYWPQLCGLLELEELTDDPRFSTAPARLENGRDLCQRIADRIGERDWAEWSLVFEGWNAPWELVRTIREVAQDPQARANDMLYDLTVTDGTTVRLVSGPVLFDGRASPDAPRRAPHLGEHTEEVLGRLGVDAASCAALRDRGTIH